MRKTTSSPTGWGAAAAQVQASPSRPPIEAAAAMLPVTEIQSPLAPAPSSILNTLVWQDLVGRDALPMSRGEAMMVPSLARMRHITCGTVARCPITVWRGDTRLVDNEEPTWTYRTDHGLPTFHRMLWTVDDTIFSGWSLWACKRGVDGDLLAANRVPIERWSFTNTGGITIDNRPQSAEAVVLIPGPHEGVLNFGRRAIREAADLATAAANAAKNPSAWLDLHYTGDEELTTEQIDALIDRWVTARRGDNGGVGFTTRHVEARELGSHESHLLIEGRNAAAVDMARVVSGPASLTDATSAGASLTYETTQGRNAEFLDYGAGLYMDAIAARLSMDDVVPRGQASRFDTSVLRDPAPSPTGPTTQD